MVVASNRQVVRVISIANINPLQIVGVSGLIFTRRFVAGFYERYPNLVLDALSTRTQKANRHCHKFVVGANVAIVFALISLRLSQHGCLTNCLSIGR